MTFLNWVSNNELSISDVRDAFYILVGIPAIILL